MIDSERGPRGTMKGADDISMTAAFNSTVQSVEGNQASIGRPAWPVDIDVSGFRIADASFPYSRDNRMKDGEPPDAATDVNASRLPSGERLGWE